MAKPTAQQCHGMTTFFMTEYEKRFAEKPVVNRNKARWFMESILMDYSTKEAKELIKHYLDSYERPSLDWLSMNYEKVIERRKEAAEKAEASAKRREVTEKKLQEWRNRWNK